MPEPDEVVTIRRLPDGTTQTARIVDRTPTCLMLILLSEEPDQGFHAGTLVEIGSPEAVFLGEVIRRQKDSLVTVAIEHFIDRAALAEISRAWKTTEGA